MAKPTKNFNDAVQLKDIVYPLPYRERSGDKFLPIMLIENGVGNIFTTIPVPIERFSLVQKATLEDHRVRLFAWPALPYMGSPRGIKVFVDKLAVEAFIKPMIKSGDSRLVEISLSQGSTLAEKAEAAANATAEAGPTNLKAKPGERVFSLKGFCLVITEKFETSMRAALVEHDFEAELRK